MCKSFLKIHWAGGCGPQSHSQDREVLKNIANKTETFFDCFVFCLPQSFTRWHDKDFFFQIVVLFSQMLQP